MSTPRFEHPGMPSFQSAVCAAIAYLRRESLQNLYQDSHMIYADFGKGFWEFHFGEEADREFNYPDAVEWVRVSHESFARLYIEELKRSCAGDTRGLFELAVETLEDRKTERRIIRSTTWRVVKCACGKQECQAADDTLKSLKFFDFVTAPPELREHNNGLYRCKSCDRMIASFSEVSEAPPCGDVCRKQTPADKEKEENLRRDQKRLRASFGTMYSLDD